MSPDSAQSWVVECGRCHRGTATTLLHLKLDGWQLPAAAQGVTLCPTCQTRATTRTDEPPDKVRTAAGGDSGAPPR